MTRKEFIKICGLLGIAVPLQTSCLTSSLFNQPHHHFEGKVIIIGAGAGGLSAAYFLQQLGIDFELVEASSRYGGRMKINNDFADFPIPLGAEWIETKPTVLSEILNDEQLQTDIKTVKDAPDYKFVNSSWFNFYAQYIVPHVFEKISFNTIVSSINYNADQVIVTTNQGQKTADKVILSVPLKMLQTDSIEFNPPLPSEKQNIIKSAHIWDGFKAFFEFSNRFYDSGFEKILANSKAGQKIFYDAAYGQNSNTHIIGLFAVGNAIDAYAPLSKSELKEVILKELDALFSKQASMHYKNHLSQNWNKEPFIKGAYLTDHADWRAVQKLGESVNKKVYFAGGEYTDGENWVSVHTAAQSAKKVVDEIINEA